MLCALMLVLLSNFLALGSILFDYRLDHFFHDKSKLKSNLQVLKLVTYD